MVLLRKNVLLADFHLSGEKNGNETGKTLSTALKDVNENHESNSLHWL
jgi:hypothetical protein